MKGLFEFIWGLSLIALFGYICTHIGTIPAIAFGMLVGMFFAIAHEHH